MATHSSVLAWRIPETGKPGGLSSLGSHRVGHDWSNLAAYWVFPAARALCWHSDSYPLYHQGSPGFFHFIQCLIGSSMQCSINASFLLMHEKHSIDLYATFCLSIYNLMVIWVVSSLGLLWKNAAIYIWVQIFVGRIEELPTVLDSNFQNSVE